MLLRRVRIQILAFALIAVVGIGYAGWRFAGLDRLFGHRGYLVTVQLERGGGLFPGADVTYRGVGVGRVTGLELTAAGVDAKLDISPDAPRIPASAKAVVSNRSAIGEQYLDLRPDTAGEPFLTDGARIRQQDTALPPRAEKLLADSDALLTSIPTDALRTVVDELDKAFAGNGPAIQQLVDTTNSFLPTATEHLPQTTSLLADGKTVTHTQRDLAEPITSFSTDVQTLARQLKTSDPDIRKLINVAPPLAQQAVDILRQSGSDLSVVMANLLTTADVVKTRVDGLEQALVLYPYVPVVGKALFPGDGTAHLGLVINFFNPMACTKGYEATKARAGSDTQPAPPNQQAYCAEPPGSPTGVRGAQNAPYGGKPREVAAPAQTAAQPGTPAPLPGLLDAVGVDLTGLGALLGLPG
ncbi:MCE family protein [Amycolatopsis sp. NPDC059027]|uniref:MCE family protein n=1 Tax=Amycolatopsis sp. NPDC059027 TaxID=3346709 RepID=UPI00366BEF5B